MYIEKTKAFVRNHILFLIKLYQKTLSLDHGPLSRFFPNGYCRFHPTCSEYTYGAVEKLGVIKGVGKGFWRVLRCNPWSKGGIDPPYPEWIEDQSKSEKKK